MTSVKVTVSVLHNFTKEKTFKVFTHYANSSADLPLRSRPRSTLGTKT
ncbi:MAG: hypothetical protein AABX52_02530 [Nanoarchaeota archaeon]